MHKPLIALTAAVALTVPLTTAVSAAPGTPSARAGQVTLVDAANDVWLWSEGTSSWELWGTKPAVDVLSADVTHGAKAIRVVMQFDDLRKRQPAEYLARIRTPKMVRSAWVKAGPVVGWGGKHQLLKRGTQIASPGFTHEIDYQADTVTMVLPRNLFDGPAWVKVKMRNNLTGNRLFTDNPHNTGWEPVYTAEIAH